MGKVESHREIRLEGNETRHRRDEGTEASDIDAQKKRGIVFRVRREHDGRRDIAHDLRKEKRDPEFVSGKERRRSFLEPRDVRQISYRDEKSEEEREQLVVDLEEGLPVKNSTSRDDDRKEEWDRKKAKDIQKTECKEKEQERDAKTRYACRLCEAEHERPVFQRIAGKEEQDGREDSDGCGDGEKFGKRQMVVGIDEKILRISDGRQHTA